MGRHRQVVTAAPEPDALAELLARCALRDEQALERLYRLTAPRLFSLALRMLKRRDWAEDLLQDCYIAVWRHAADYRTERGQALAWMAAILRNRALDWLRRLDPETPLDDESAAHEPVGDEPGPLEHVQSSAMVRALQECLERLQPGQRQAIAFAYYQGLTHEELASRLGEPLGTVKTWIRRGLEQLRRCLGR
ncbi:sigma-70 family RNA polymerase sigma factor [Pelomicrobium methylotrophicum]|uniref:Sigma-70 family RNA polymerase sigma factor n=1 Tax=Pelomicrobium methylotrophicum TaxID=2602750 RepID=A0A5C7EKV9_9PROT|nr:sigma-70 family RNA polymerase sigma factor [Pelomicrobium methylotrophicum]TXF11712.1 sigma-70 family RNA polymerase sigma factor [Pelomicrobium methylotrophicum]